jgi:acetyl esterase
MVWFWDAYAPNANDRKKITASPLRATTEQLAGLPPALIMVDENDVLRDEGEAYARKLIEAGVEVTALRVLATFHDFAMLNPLAATPATRGAIRLAADKLSEALSLLSAEKTVAAQATAPSDCRSLNHFPLKVRRARAQPKSVCE